MARPKVLDDGKRDMICALATAGMRMRKIAEYVGCSMQTIGRERRENEEFDERLRRARAATDLKPLEAMRRASATHWRAAAWMLDRSDRRFEERRPQKTAGVEPKKVSAVCDAVLGMMRNELMEQPLVLCRLEANVQRLFRVALASSGSSEWDIERRQQAELRKSMEFLDKRLAEREKESGDHQEE